MQEVLILTAVMAAFYFILLRPVINQQKQQRRDISSLQVGDEVMTTGGFYATVTDINTYEDRPMEIVFLLGPGLQVRGTTNAIASIVRRAHPDDTGAIPR